jgi:SMC interacting uncharacterized protein involved in chromosome segregation
MTTIVEIMDIIRNQGVSVDRTYIMQLEDILVLRHLEKGDLLPEMLRMDTVMVRESDIPERREKVLKILQRLQEQGLIKRVGQSPETGNPVDDFQPTEEGKGLVLVDEVMES